jgi:hypothetical protein
MVHSHLSSHCVDRDTHDMQSNAGLTRSLSFRIVRGVSLELLPLAAPFAAFGAFGAIALGLALETSGAPAGAAVLAYLAGVVLMPAFLLTGLGWFAEGRTDAGSAFLVVRAAFALLCGFAVVTGFAQTIDCGSACEDVWVQPGLLLGGLVAFGAPLVSAGWLALTIAREPRDSDQTTAIRTSPRPRWHRSKTLQPPTSDF